MMYDLSRFNSIAELEELISDIKAVLRDKKTDHKVRALCNQTLKEANRKLLATKKNNGL